MADATESEVVSKEPSANNTTSVDAQEKADAPSTTSSPAADPDPTPALPENDTPKDAGFQSLAVQDVTAPDDGPKSALAARMARFKALQAERTSGKKATQEAVIEEKKIQEGKDQEYQKAKALQERTEYKLLKADDPDFERKRHWDYTAEEDEKWSKRVTKKARNKDNNAFQDYTREANKVYKRQIKQLSTLDREEYAASRAEKLQRQVAAGLLDLIETDAGEIYTVDKLGRVNTPVEENYNCDHKPSKEAVDRLVDQLQKSEDARLKARQARGIKDDDTAGDVTYINQKNKQFNDKLARFYNKYTAEIRDSFERGTAI
jgi:pre-mRNA-splicing factor SYF2